jgi:hypothetical protein
MFSAQHQPSRFFMIGRSFSLALACGWLVSCATQGPSSLAVTQVLNGDRLADADELLKRAEGLTTDAEAAAVYSLRAGEIAWKFLDTDGGSVADVKALPLDQRHALKVLTTATENLAPQFTGANYQPVRTFSHAGYSYQVDASRVKGKGMFPLAKLVGVKPAHEVPRKLCKNWHCEDGAGAAFSPRWSIPNDPGMSRFVSKSRGYLEPISGVLTFDSRGKTGAPRRASLTGYDPTMISRVRLGATDYPLAADFTAPIVDQTQDIQELRIALQGLIHPDVLDAKLIMLEPYNPQRIPVLLVHGLNSHPRMWRDVINDLRADPELRGRYQFMVFYYPTGWPISYSSMRLREELAAFEQKVGKPKNMLLVGHSMGGLLSRMQVVTPGKVIWNTQLGNEADRLDRKLPPNHLVRRMLQFQADPDITRQVYICTPHRGSSLADLSLTNWFVKILALPTRISGAILDIPGALAEPAKMTSVKGLSPTNPLYTALDQIPIEVPHHTIVGDRGKGDTPNSSDGVVPYSSSHLAEAESEVIVPDGHGGFKHPLAIEELRRILLLHAGIQGNP